jgi:hypothetical protein
MLLSGELGQKYSLRPNLLLNRTELNARFRFKVRRIAESEPEVRFSVRVPANFSEERVPTPNRCRKFY